MQLRRALPLAEGPLPLPGVLPHPPYASYLIGRMSGDGAMVEGISGDFFNPYCLRNVQGMLRSSVVGPFYKDLMNPAFKTAFAIYHRRYSTNTTPKWPLAQPFRVLGHNGAPPLLDFDEQSPSKTPFDRKSAALRRRSSFVCQTYQGL